MKERLITGLVLALVLIPMLFVSVTLFTLILGVFSVVAGYEIIRVFTQKHSYRRGYRGFHMVATGFLYTLMVVDYLQLLSENLLSLGLLFVMIVVLVWYVFDEKLETTMAAKSFLAMVYVAFGFAAISMTRSISLELLGYLLILTMATDVFAYFSGYLFGRHKLAPLISPKKTVEGAIGGTVVAVIIATVYRSLMPSFTDLSLVLVILLGIIVSFLAQIGDLVASKLKRAHDVKDFSHLLPGHGGLLDRFDSSIFAAMALMIAMMFIEVL